MKGKTAPSESTERCFTQAELSKDHFVSPVELKTTGQTHKLAKLPPAMVILAHA